MKIESIGVNAIADSRGDPTIALVVKTQEGRSFFAQVPSGKSTGKKEAVVFSPEKAKETGEGLAQSSLAGREFSSIQEFDAALLELDPSREKKTLGGNLALGVSLAAARALAFGKRQELWELMREEFFAEENGMQFPFIFANLIEGGLHAENNLDIQEYMVVVSPGFDPGKAFRGLKDFYCKLGELLGQSGESSLGDEAGYVKDFQSNREPLEVLSGLISKEKKEYSLALDSAASALQKGSGYVFEGKTLSAPELQKVYQEYLSAFPRLLFLEDPFSQDDADSFSGLLDAFPKLWVAGDDISATRKERIKELAEKKAISAVIIKPNQVGTVTETCRAIQEAKRQNLKVVISHRSGETDDSFLVSFARACNAEGVKIGAPARERLLKYRELLGLYRQER